MSVLAEELFHLRSLRIVVRPRQRSFEILSKFGQGLEVPGVQIDNGAREAVSDQVQAGDDRPLVGANKCPRVKMQRRRTDTRL
jgi:hypothetical protein